MTDRSHISFEDALHVLSDSSLPVEGIVKAIEGKRAHVEALQKMIAERRHKGEARKDSSGD
jgi:hypothetical protein